DAIKVLLDGYGLNDPVIDDRIGAFTDPAVASLYQQLVTRGLRSSSEALQVGAYIEEYDLLDLEAAIREARAGTNPEPVITTYQQLACGSRNHLRAFVKQLDRYQAQLMEQDAVELVTGSEQEDCGSSR
ncbi:MAG: DUF2202 domain-containing protein, partial [Thiolinea sp.]